MTSPSLKSQSSQAPIVIRDRRKPNQFTTDNVIAREWLPILRVGDAFFFYSVYLSMANRETESSWGSLRTMARYLQCGVDLIIRGNRLLEICELVHIETGNQHTSNKYYILDPPSLTQELVGRIQHRLDGIAEQETGKNWQSWVKQVRKALSSHNSLTSIWEERRANRGGRPVKTLRAQYGVREPQPGFEGKGDSEPQAGYMCATTTAHVGHMQGVRDAHAEQADQTRQTEQESKSETTLSLPLVRAKCQDLGLQESTIDRLVAQYSPSELARQLEWLPSRHPRDPAAMLISALQGCWDAPAQHDPARAQEVWAEWQADRRRAAPKEPEDRSSTAAYALGEDALDAREVWGGVLADLQTQMSRASFDTWLSDTQVLRVEAGKLIVGVGDEYTAEWLRTRWLAPIQRAVTDAVGTTTPVLFQVKT